MQDAQKRKTKTHYLNSYAIGGHFGPYGDDRHEIAALFIAVKRLVTTVMFCFIAVAENVTAVLHGRWSWR